MYMLNIPHIERSDGMKKIIRILIIIIVILLVVVLAIRLSTVAIGEVVRISGRYVTIEVINVGYYQWFERLGRQLLLSEKSDFSSIRIPSKNSDSYSLGDYILTFTGSTTEETGILGVNSYFDFKIN